MDGCEILHHQTDGWNPNKRMGFCPSINWWFGYRWPIHRMWRFCHYIFTDLPLLKRSIHSSTVMAMAISYNWLFLWDKKHSINGVLLVLISSYNWYNSGLNCNQSWIFTKQPQALARRFPCRKIVKRFALDVLWSTGMKFYESEQTMSKLYQIILYSWFSN